MAHHTKSTYAAYLQSEHWQETRKQIIAEFGHQCVRCYLPRWLSKLVYSEDLHVHHKNYACLGKETPEDVEPLCKRCHELETFGRTDLPPLKTASCACCEIDHYDLYGELCTTCRSIHGIDFPFHTIFGMKDPYSELQVWQLVMDEVRAFLDWRLNSPQVEAFDVAKD